MFALTDLQDELSINLKSLPEKAIDLREHYPCVLPGYHMNKVHWNTVIIDGSVDDSLIRQWIDESYNLVLSGIKPKKRNALNL